MVTQKRKSVWAGGGGEGRRGDAAEGCFPLPRLRSTAFTSLQVLIIFLQVAVFEFLFPLYCEPLENKNWTSLLLIPPNTEGLVLLGASPGSPTDMGVTEWWQQSCVSQLCTEKVSETKAWPSSVTQLPRSSQSHLTYPSTEFSGHSIWYANRSPAPQPAIGNLPPPPHPTYTFSVQSYGPGWRWSLELFLPMAGFSLLPWSGLVQ